MICRVPDGFFRLMPHLRVFDLSRTHITKLAIEVGMLRNLRFLNLAYTNLTSLPIELEWLAKLAYLDLTCSFFLYAISHNVLSKLSSLNVLYMFRCVYGDWISEDSDDDDADAETVSWKQVGCVGGRLGDDEMRGGRVIGT